MNAYGQIRIPVSDSFVEATLTDSGWQCDDDNIREFLDVFHPPELASHLPAPWERTLFSAARETGGEVVASASPRKASGIH